MTAPSDYRWKWGSSTPHREELLQPHSRDNGRLGDNNRPHPPATHPGSPAALSIQLADRGEKRPPPWSLAVTKTVRGIAGPLSVTATPPGEHSKAAAVTDSSNRRDRSRQSGFGGAISGQKTATGHTETTRANAMKPLAVHKPPTIAPRPHKGKQQTRRSTPTASRPLNRARKAERQREQQDRTQEPFDQERAQSTLPASKAEDREVREDPNWSSTRKTHPPHHLAERAEMRRERQPRTEKSPEDSPSPTPRRAYRDEEGDSTVTEQVAGVRRKRATPGSPVHEWTEETEASSHAPNARPEAPPPLPLDQDEREERKTPGSNTRASRDCPPPSRPSEGREREEGKTRGAWLPKKSLM